MWTGHRNPEEKEVWPSYISPQTNRPTPSLREELADSSGTHLSKEGSSVHCPEVRQVTIEVDLLCHNSEPSSLQEGGEEKYGGREKYKKGGSGQWTDLLKVEA